jgi:hypothetical protein
MGGIAVNAFYDDLSGFGSWTPVQPHNPFALGPEVTLNDSGVLSPHNSSIGHGHPGGGGGGGGTGGTGGTTPVPTLVSSTTGGNLSIDLVWDSSVANATTGFTAAVAAAAQLFVNDLTTATKTVLYIAVGWGEIAGSPLSAGALGESESNGYLTNYSTVANALAAHHDNVSASNEPTSAQFFVTSAEAKILGLVNPTGGSTTSVDGYIAFGTNPAPGYNWFFGTTGTASNQFNLQSVAAHEVSEVMGRISMEGTATYNGLKTYTPLDLFDFSSYNNTTNVGTLSLSNTGGYFSNDNGYSHQGNFNPANLYPGDIGDWASWNSTSDSGTVTSGQDAFNAFGRPGLDGTVSKDDLWEMVALGLSLTAAGQAVT